jgi:hypothetical protein
MPKARVRTQAKQEPEPKTDRIGKAVVPVVVAIIGLLGVVIAALLNRQDSNAKESQAIPGPTIEVTSWGTEDVPPPPTVILHFRGTASIPLEARGIVILARFSAADKAAYKVPGASMEQEYFVSPYSLVNSDGTWEVSWKLPKAPKSATYTAAAIVRSISGGCPDPQHRCPMSLRGINYDLLRVKGPVADIVRASAVVTGEPDR